jgi:hypothetical protein
MKGNLAVILTSHQYYALSLDVIAIFDYMLPIFQYQHNKNVEEPVCLLFAQAGE